MKSTSNQNLTVNKSVVLTDVIDAVITALDPYFIAAGVKGRVTSGLRDAENQLNIIRGYLAKTGLDKKYPDAITKGLKEKIEFEGKIVFAWQPGWSALLNAGVIINPPVQAELLMDYIVNGENRKGKIYNATPHMNGNCFDIGGGEDGDISNELVAVNKALADKLPGLKSIVIERKNNCIHCNCIKIQTT